MDFNRTRILIPDDISCEVFNVQAVENHLQNVFITVFT
jgi:hypothetical protein